MTTQPLDHETECLMCAVRALTEGDPVANWAPETAGQVISGVVLRQGTISTDLFGPVPFVDLWLGGTGRVRVRAYASGLKHALASAAAQVGDRLSVEFNGFRVVASGKFAGKQIKDFTATVQRGH